MNKAHRPKAYLLFFQGDRMMLVISNFQGDRMMLVIIFEQIFLLYFDAGGRSLLIGDHLENCWLATSNSCIIDKS